MLFDFQYGGAFDSGLAAFPDWPFSSPPKEDTGDTVAIPGTDSGYTINLIGSSDPPN